MELLLGSVAFIIAIATIYALIKPAILTRQGKTPPRWLIAIIGFTAMTLMVPIMRE